MGVRIKTTDGRVLGEMGTPGGASASLLSSAGTRKAPIAANTDFTVPSYVVGSGQLRVWLDGLLCVEGVAAAHAQYREIGTKDKTSTVIQWHQSIDDTYEIYVRVNS